MPSNDIDIQKSLELDSDNSTNIADTESEEEEDVSSPKRRRTESPTNKFAGAFKYKTKFQKNHGLKLAPLWQEYREIPIM